MTKQIYFVLGGPGSGKGTFCSSVVGKYGHLVSFFSAGDLLREYVKTDLALIKDQNEAELLNKIKAIMLAGEIVPAEVTIGLLLKAVSKSPNKYILIDGFPRNEENSKIWQKLNKEHPEIHVIGLIYLQCK